MQATPFRKILDIIFRHYTCYGNKQIILQSRISLNIYDFRMKYFFFANINRQIA